MNFINKRDTAYPTMLELLVAAVKFVDHLDTSEQYSHLLEKFPKAKDIKPTMDKRALHKMNVACSSGGCYVYGKTKYHCWWFFCKTR